MASEVPMDCTRGVPIASGIPVCAAKVVCVATGEELIWTSVGVAVKVAVIRSDALVAVALGSGDEAQVGSNAGAEIGGATGTKSE
jgi:hypothetical protein